MSGLSCNPNIYIYNFFPNPLFPANGANSPLGPNWLIWHANQHKSHQEKSGIRVRAKKPKICPEWGTTTDWPVLSQLAAAVGRFTNVMGQNFNSDEYFSVMLVLERGNNLSLPTYLSSEAPVYCRMTGHRGSSPHEIPTSAEIMWVNFMRV